MDAASRHHHLLQHHLLRLTDIVSSCDLLSRFIAACSSPFLTPSQRSSPSALCGLVDVSTESKTLLLESGSAEVLLAGTITGSPIVLDRRKNLLFLIDSIRLKVPLT
eukprot:GHRR01031037.1.p2 GENE.GHRR01031037.1~~GHRR01031037.1.p2  ORF type:complete len:107 (+),score=21.77 GHRR01031037.1:827-1147(+)